MKVASVEYKERHDNTTNTKKEDYKSKILFPIKTFFLSFGLFFVVWFAGVCELPSQFHRNEKVVCDMHCRSTRRLL